MRLVRALLTERNRESVLEALREKDIDFVLTSGDEESADTSIVEFPVPADGLGDVLDSAREAGLDDEYVVIISAENAITPNTETLRDRYANDYDPLRPPELRSKARNQSQDPGSYAAMIFLSAVIAAIGLLVDSAAIMVGSMVIAPLVGPTLTAAVGGITGDRAMVVDSVRIQALGLVAAVLGATALAAFMNYSGFVPTPLDVDSIELIGVRMAPGLPSLLVGTAAGSAAAFGLTTKGSNSLVGVMIAAALIPAAAVVGIAIVWGEPLIALGGAALLVSTMAAINLSLYATLWVLYRSQEFDPALLGDRTTTRAGLVTVALIVLAVAIAGAGTYQQASFQHAVTGEVESVLDEPAYESLSVVSIRTQYGGTDPFRSPESVTVTLTKNANASYPQLSNRLYQQVAAATDPSVTVSVRFVTYQRTSGPEENASARSVEKRFEAEQTRSNPVASSDTVVQRAREATRPGAANRAYPS
ncbi:DUF389 domain-containing protein [Halobacteriales archaeon QS_3_64_16]|nr:MAG: DUF389 domain-containing protein [Halobacteriales archaeon QS_3_64_16]